MKNTGYIIWSNLRSSKTLNNKRTCFTVRPCETGFFFVKISKNNSGLTIKRLWWNDYNETQGPISRFYGKITLLRMAFILYLSIIATLFSFVPAYCFIFQQPIITSVLKYWILYLYSKYATINYNIFAKRDYTSFSCNFFHCLRSTKFKILKPFSYHSLFWNLGKTKLQIWRTKILSNPIFPLSPKKKVQQRKKEENYYHWKE